MDLLILIFVILIGLSIGSFINVCIYRIPEGKSIVSPPSSCPGCGERIKAIDLIPVFSYIFLMGKCRNCGERISIRYPLVEILTAVLFAGLYLKFGLEIKTLIFAAIISILIMIFFIDLEHMIIPDGLNLLIALFGITLNIVYAGGNYKAAVLNMLFGLLLGGGLFFILGLIGAMGGGDIKLMAALGIVFGWKLLIPLMFLSFLLGGIIGIALIVLKIKKIKDMIPFGPYIAAASVITAFYGSEMVHWYMRSFMIY